MAPKDRYDSPSPDRRHDEERNVTPVRPPPPRPEPSAFDRIHAAATRAALESEAARADISDVLDALKGVAKHAEDAAKNSASAARRAGRAEDGIARLLPQDDSSIPPMRAMQQTHPDGEWHEQTGRTDINARIAEALEKQRVAENDRAQAEEKRASEKAADRRFTVILTVGMAVAGGVARLIEVAARGHW